MAELNRAAWLGCRTFQHQLAHYPGGGARYQRHRDALAGAGSPSHPRRLVTAIYYLNPNWTPADGGELVVHPPGGAVTLAPLLDRLVMFSAIALPSTRSCRCSRHASRSRPGFISG